MAVYYNENDEQKAAWLEELIKRNLIAPGDVDERSIREIDPSELHGYTQHHFFAGIGVWSYALRCAGWPDDKPIWTGSCPCQPFSVAGQQKGFSDDRHLWPEWFRLIAELQPLTIVGEEVAGKNGLAWLDNVQDDLEWCDYVVGAVVIPACGFGAPHRRERLYFMASNIGNREKRTRLEGHFIDDEYETSRLAHTEREQKHQEQPRPSIHETRRRTNIPSGCCLVNQRLSGPTNGFWRDPDWLYCRDGKWRPVESSTFPLAHGAPERMGRLRGYGDAIVASQAQAFIEAVIEVEKEFK